jgi:FKBP-type peptidyl-prolyl cis-trans isomerase SlyD
MKICSSTKATLIYTLKTDSGKTIEQVQESNPAVFNFGQNLLLPEFEKQLKGLQKGDDFSIRIDAENAYGPVDPYAIFDIPIDTFEVDGKVDEKMIQMGNIIPMTDNQGNKHHGKIIKILKDAVTLDFNHPLAGENLNFVGKIISVDSNL